MKVLFPGFHSRLCDCEMCFYVVSFMSLDWVGGCFVYIQSVILNWMYGATSLNPVLFFVSRGPESNYLLRSAMNSSIL